MKRLRDRLCAGLALVALAGSSAISAEASKDREYQAKAALIFKLTEHVVWPARVFPDKEAQLSICVLGDDPFGAALRSLGGRRSNGRVTRVLHFPSVHDLKYCPVLFVSPSEHPRQAQLLEALRHAPVLTIGETKGFAESGGIIELVRLINGVAYDVNLAAARSAGLELEEGMVRLARRVVEQP